MPECLPESCTTSASERGFGVGTETLTFDVTGFIRELLQAGEAEVYHKVQDEVERILLREVLESVGGNQVKASQLLGISRTTLRAKLGNLALGGAVPPHSLAAQPDQLSAG